jgi:hypothetical protein
VSRASYLFTSESVSEGHPDKVCDRISDQVVDAFFAIAPQHGWDPRHVRVACETLTTTNPIVIAGETGGPAAITGDYIAHIARLAVKDIGYEQAGFHWMLLHAVAGHRPGRRFDWQQGRRRRRSGYHVRLCLPGDAETDASADLLCAPHPHDVGSA